MIGRITTFLFAILCGTALARGQGRGEDDYYRLLRFPIPPHIALEPGALEFLPDGKLAVATRRGEVYLIDKPLAENPDEASFSLFASGMHEVLGLAWRDDWLYCVQRCEVTRIKDANGDGRADVFETVSDGWGLTGDYHEYAFGSKFDRDGNLWVVLCLTGSFSSEALFRGWCLRVTPEGKVIPTSSGIRSPGPSTAYAAGIGLAATWDPELAQQVGRQLGHDARARGSHYLLGPGVNIYRAPMNGRNFEYFGEDPWLGSRIAVGYIRGVQEEVSAPR